MSSDFPADGDAEEFDVAEYDVEFDPDEADSDASDACDDEFAAEPSACAYTDYSPSGNDPDEVPATGAGAEGIEADVWDALYEVEDPEMPVSVVDLGLIYGVEVDERVDEGETPEKTHGGGSAAGVHAEVVMTLTYTGCPARDMLTDEIEAAVAGVSGVESVDLRLVWSPEWSIEMVTERGKEDLNDFGLSV